MMRAGRNFVVLLLVSTVIVVAATAAAVLGGDGERVDWGSDGVIDTSVEELHDECADGDMAACDVLYFEAEEGSDEQEFASTCGDTTKETAGGCVDGDEGFDDEIHQLTEGCFDGDMAACDDLYFAAEERADERLGSTCGFRYEPTMGACVEREEREIDEGATDVEPEDEPVITS